MENTRPVTINPMADELFEENPKLPQKGRFHKWTTKKHHCPEAQEDDNVFNEVDYGLIEMSDGSMEYFRPDQIVFDIF